MKHHKCVNRRKRETKRRVLETNNRFAFAVFASVLLLSAMLSTQFNPVLVTQASASVYLTQAGDFLKFGNEYLEFTFDLSRRDVPIYSFYNKLTGQELIQDKSHLGPSWLAYTLEELWFNGFIMNDFHWSQVGDETNMTLILIWEDLQYGGIHPLNVTATINVQSGNPLTNWNIRFENKDPDISLHSIFFPFIHSITYLGDSPENDRLVTPFFEGLLIPEPYNVPQDWNYFQTYPGGLSMQFLLFCEENIGGYYFAAHDPENYYKAVEFKHEYGRTFKFDFSNFVAGIQPGNSYYQPYPIILGVFQGKDWIDGAEIYKAWATQQWWCSKGKIVQRTDVPDRLKDTIFSGFDCSYSTNPQTGEIEGEPVDSVWGMGESARELRKLIPESEILLEWWGWGKGGHDRLYPEMFPPRDGEAALKACIQVAHEHNVSVMLFFNGRWIDTVTKTYQEIGKDYVCLDEKGYPYIEGYGAGGYLTAAVACPYTEFCKEVLVNLTVTAVRDYEVDGVYLDMIPVACSYLCFNSTHGHPIGGGNWWAAAYTDILDAVRTEIRKYNPEAIVTAESVNEVYIPNLDGFVTYELQWPFNGIGIPYVDVVQANGISIPLFSYVYHEYSLLMYTFAPAVTWGDYPISYWMLGQEVLRGGIPAVYYSPHIDDRIVNYVRNLAKARTTYAKPYLVEGQIVDIIETPSLQANYTHPPWWPWSGRIITAPTVYEYVYKGSDGKIGIFTANVANVSQTVPIEIDFKRLSLDPTRTYSVYDLTNGTVIGEISRTQNAIMLEIPGRGLSVLGFVPKYFTGDFNEDGNVNILDITIVARAFGSYLGHPMWNPIADVAEPYDIINIVDITKVAKEYGKIL